MTTAEDGRRAGSQSGQRLLCIAANPAIDRLLEVKSLVPGHIHRPDSALSVAGGKGLNMARAAARLGAPVVAVALLGGDAGRWVARQLDAAGVLSSIVWAGHETRLCLSILDQGTRRLTEFYEAGPTVEAGAWHAFETAVEELMEGEDLLITLSGSLPAGASPQSYARFCRLARERSRPIIVDAWGEALRATLPERPWLIKVNASEASHVTGLPARGERGALAAAHALAQHAQAGVIVTRGRHGALVVSRDGAWRIGPPPAGGSYPVGSGDCFLAGLAAGLLRRQPLAEAALLGAAAAAVNATQPGPAIFDADEVAPMRDRLRPELERIGR